MLPKVELRTNYQTYYAVEVFNPSRQEPSRFALAGNAGEKPKLVVVKERGGNICKDVQEIWQELQTHQS